MARYRYDASGNRIAKTVDGQTTYFLYDTGHRLVAEADESGTLTLQYLYADFRPYMALKADGRRQTRARYAIHSDPRGVPLAVTDDRQTVVWRAAFDAFGNARGTLGQPSADANGGNAGGFHMNLRFAGQYADKETGLYYNVHRYYDPQQGRYLTPDPIGLAGGEDAYAYVGSNPLADVDPLGLFKIPPTKFMSGSTLLAVFGIPSQDGGHGDILRTAFAQYNRENGVRFSQTIIDQIIRNNYWTDAGLGGQFNASNHWDNPNNGPMYTSEGGGKTSTYTDGSGDNWLQEALNLVNTNRQNYTKMSGGLATTNIGAIISAFGQNSHIIADFYAHTNWVDAKSRGGCVYTEAAWGNDEQGWVPVGMEQTTLWNETVSDKLFSGTAASTNRICAYPLGDVNCTKDETAHGYWNKDSNETPGGKEKYNGPKMDAWEVQIYNPSAKPGEKGNPKGTFGVDWYTDYGITQSMVKPGTRIYVKVKVERMHQLAFQLAIDHTKQEIAKLYNGAVGLEANGLKLTDIFKMNVPTLINNGVNYYDFSLNQ